MRDLLAAVITTLSSPQLLAALIAIGGVLLTLWVNSNRAERQRRRELHARALAAVVIYREMPFRIRRRAAGDQQRARLADDFSQNKAEILVCQVLLAADGDERVAVAYDALVETARRTAGHEAHKAWKTSAIVRDDEMNAGDLHRRLAVLNDEIDEFSETLRRATLARRKRARRRARKVLPFCKDHGTLRTRRQQAPQDRPSADVVSGSEA